ncbi:murein transglycosylase A [Candidatus Riflebacteria bacterium]
MPADAKVKHPKKHLHFFYLIVFYFFLLPGLNGEEMLGKGYDFEGNGKDLTAKKLPRIYTETKLSGVEIRLPPSDEFIKLITAHKIYFNRKKTLKKITFPNLEINSELLLKALAALLHWQRFPGTPLEKFLKTYQLKGEDGHGNVHFTGYFSPVLQVKSKKDEKFKYPLYRKPESWQGKKLPSRKEIDFADALIGEKLELAWSKSLLDNFFLQVQGSGFIEYADGSIKTLHFGGANGHAYKSIGRYLVNRNFITAENISLKAIREWFAKNPGRLAETLSHNPSYTFFTLSSSPPTGSMNVPLFDCHSIAVDSSYIPLGSVLIGKVPILSDDGNLSHHEYRILFAQDRGGAIKGPGHVDLYSGRGKEAEKKASNLHHYGKLWLLLPL